ncbi:uncharacterized protein LOC100893631 [Strongylocentrotus purpuratus]|uniref:Uncharacterized protein n=1 Tax=Strongylocentrotus purpuratus TaxID=7668 RepID=A0A7M7P951_STRPU|nr:uncharacterized protein LOC100893631 [Strongylocentrotus purpuratus]XP_030847282.1 uncharacterized protein LOC100893631 [Strongylocentrotus purpuratus]
MEPHDMIAITVNQGTSMIDCILFQKPTPDDVSATDSFASFDLTQDCLNSKSNQIPKSASSGLSSCTEDGNQKDSVKEKCISAQESANQRNIVNNQNNEQIRGGTQHDSRPTISTNAEFIQLGTDIDPILASCFMCEMRHSQVYRQLFMKNLCTWCCSSKRTTKEQKRSTGIRLALHLRQSNLFKMEADIRWSVKMLPLWLARIAMEDSFSWLSTLGGAYSALGDDFQNFAEKAGRVSIRQMKLACQIGDPILLARCRVYMAQSLMQNGYIQHAMFIVRAQYRFAISLGENTDQRLINMCRGVWSIIQYIHIRKKEKRRKNGVGLHREHGKAR